MTEWAYSLFENARAEKKDWSNEDQVRLHELLDTLCRNPEAGSHDESSDCWVYKKGVRPQLQITYHLDRDSRHVRVISLGRRHIDYGDVLVFLSHSHDDRAWFERLREGLRKLEDLDICIWCDDDIDPGQKWLDLIRENLQESGAALLLVSPSFLASDFICTTELPAVLERAEDSSADTFLLLWVPLAKRKVIEQNELGRKLLAYQALLDPRKPLNKIPRWRLDGTLRDLRHEVNRMIHRRLRRRLR